MSIIIPQDFREFRVSQDGEAATAWLKTVPLLIENAPPQYFGWQPVVSKSITA